jgi:transposase
MPGVSGKAERDRRRRRAVAMRGHGMTVRAIAAVLGVSHPTVLRDLRAHDQTEAEQVLAVLAGEPQGPKARPPRLSREQRRATRQDKFWRRYYAVELRRRGLSLRAIAREVGAGLATVLRDLRQDPLWQAIERGSAS